MNRRRILSALGVILISVSAEAQTDARKAMDLFQSMAGSWRSSNGDSVTYKVVAGGTAVMAEMNMHSDAMTSMIYLDGDRLMLTHFCPSGNQPRMQAEISPDLKTITFEFSDATNLTSPQAGHMHRAVYTFLSPTHYREDWTWRQEGKDSHMTMDLEKK